jgi:hypothetical protein
LFSIGLFLAGCAARETVQFSTAAGQSSFVRDGQPIIVSPMHDSIVMVWPASRELRSGARPVFVVAATNRTRNPFDLRTANIHVFQTINGVEAQELPIVTYEELVSEERTRQAVAALATGIAAGANAYSASQAGYGHMYGTVNTGYGIQTVSTTYYDPTAAAVAQSNAAATNDALISAAVQNGQRNLASLERNVLKDNTIMPGEWVGGQLFFAPPQAENGQAKSYRILIRLGGDSHSIDIVQSRATR